MTNRRDFCLTIGSLAAALCLPVRTVRAMLQDGSLEVSELREGRWLITEGGGNSLLIATGEGSILVDTKVAGMGLKMAGTVRNTDAAPKFVINTHHHADHTGGNFAFSNSEIIAHANVRPKLKKNLETRFLPALKEQVEALKQDGQDVRAERLTQRISTLSVKDFAADRTISEQGELKLGGASLDLRHHEPGHTDNDLVVHLPEENLVHAGDLLFHELNPFIDRPAGANTRGWQRVLLKLIDMCDEETVVIPGHGEVTDVNGVRAQYGYFDILRGAVQQSMKLGKSREEITKLKPDLLVDFGFERLLPRGLGAMYDELSEE
jgi:glyoxylase-like metal-dependent hydrolase (beta-lactamase superfamily II)